MKVSQTAQVTPIQNTNKENWGDAARTIDSINGLANAEKEKGSAPKKVEHVKRMNKTIGDAHVAATPKKGNKSLKEDMEARGKVAPRKKKIR